MTRKFLIPACLALAAAALLGACKAGDTAGDTGATTSASTGATPSAPKPGATGQQSAAGGTTTVHADGVRRISVAELQSMLADGRTVMYDTRAKLNYDQEHIKGALPMPGNEVEARAGELPRDKTLVFYCT